MNMIKATLVILGASGDLTRRLLLPGLGSLLRTHHDHDIKLVGAAAADLNQDDWRTRVGEALRAGGCSPAQADALVASTRFRLLDVADADAMRAFLADLEEDGRPIVLYFALPPAVSQEACRTLGQVELPTGIRLAIEKPFGSDLQSARAFNELLTRLVPEDRVFRVDHYLGKSTVLNLMGLRFGNRILAPIWNGANIERVEIIVDETLGLEGRAGYYDRAGALKDMIQSHLLLVMAMFAMEEPARIDAIELRDHMSHTLRQVHLVGDDGVKSSRRARYTAGKVGDREIPDYVNEPGVRDENQTETLAEVNLEIHNARWAGVHFRLRSGKALGDGMHAIVVKLRDVDYLPEGFEGAAPANVLVIGMAPERLVLRLATNGGGRVWHFEETSLCADLGESPLRPYGEILEGILTGDPLLGVRGDIAEECWRIVTPVLTAWRSGQVPLDEYSAGSTGPHSWR